MGFDLPPCALPPLSLCPPSRGGHVSRGLSRNHYPVTHTEYPILSVCQAILAINKNQRDGNISLQKAQSFRLSGGIPLIFFNLYFQNKERQD